MPALIRTFATLALLAGAAHAQVPEVTHTCVANCGDSSSSSGDARTQEALRQEKADEIRIDAENAARKSKEARIHTIRRTNERGVAAFQHEQWGLAEAYFEAALKVDPGNPLAQHNLDETRRQIATIRAKREADLAAQRQAAAIAEAKRAMDAEQHRLAKLLAHGPVVPPPGSGPQVGAALTRDAPLAMPGAQAFIANAARQRVLAVGNVVDTAKSWLDVMTPEGLFLRREANIVTLATDTIPKLLTDAASGDAVPEPILGLGGATVIMNSGTEPGELADKMVRIGSTQAAALDEAKDQLAAVVGDALGPLGKGLDVRAALEQVEQLPVVQRWTK